MSHPSHSDWETGPSTTKEIPLRSGIVLNGRYQIDSRIGEGGMAIVYAGTDLNSGRRVALKISSSASAQDETFVARLRREAKAAIRTEHDNIVKVLDFGQTPVEVPDGAAKRDRWYIVMELLDGIDLDDFILMKTQCQPIEMIFVLDGILSALEHAHSLGVVHRDLKPSNIFLTVQSDHAVHVKLIDFGVVKMLGGSHTHLTHAGSVLGTPEFMAPEQAVGGAVDARSDLYAVGCIAYAMLCGQPPFEDKNPLRVLTAHATLKPDPVFERRPDLKEWQGLDEFITRALEKEPDKRFQTPAEMRDALCALATDMGLPEPAKIPMTLPTGWQSRNPATPHVTGDVTLLEVPIGVANRYLRGRHTRLLTILGVAAAAGLLAFLLLR